MTTHLTQRDFYIDFIKFLAIFFMLIDHIGHYFLSADLPSTLLFRGFGRLAMPLFFIAHGYLLARVISHPPALSRIIKFIIYALFITVTFLVLDKVKELNMLFTFALLELIWLALWRCNRLFIIAAIFILATVLTIINITLQLINVDEIDYIGMWLLYGTFPLFYSVVGSLLGHRSSNKQIQIAAFSLLAMTLSFQYNIYIYLAISLVVDCCYITYILPTLVIPILSYYLSKQPLQLPTLELPIQKISSYALPIYVIHLQVIAIILILFKDISL